MFRAEMFLAWMILVTAAVGPPAVARADDQRSSGENQQSAGDADLLAVLQSDAPLEDKAKACKRLAVVATSDAIPVLAELLSDETLAHYARFALEPMPDPAVDDALRDAIPHLEGELLIGVVNSIGFRRDRKSVDALTRLLQKADPGVQTAAAAALSRIATSRAAKQLRRALHDTDASRRARIADACLACGDVMLSEGNSTEAVVMFNAVRNADVPQHLVRAATQRAILADPSDGLQLLSTALRSENEAMFDMALGVARELEHEATTQTLLDVLSELKQRRRALLLVALGDRKDPQALPAVMQAAREGSTQVREAALHSLEHLGDADAVDTLLAAAVAVDPRIRDTARQVLARLPGDDVDQALIEKIGHDDPRKRQAVVQAVGRRRLAAAVPALEKAASDPNAAVRLAAIVALGRTIRLEHLAVLSRRLVASQSPDELQAAEDAMLAACIRMPDRDACVERLSALVQEAPDDVRQTLIDVMGAVGGPAALKAVAAYARTQDDQLRDAATRVLGEWMSADAAPVLEELAKTLPDGKYKIRAVRGYIRIARQLKLPKDKRLAMCRTAMEIAERDAEKKLVLEVLKRNPSIESLQLATTQLNDDQLKESAATAAVEIADKLASKHPQEVIEAMRSVIEAAPTAASVSDRAKAVAEEARVEKARKAAS